MIASASILFSRPYRRVVILASLLAMYLAVVLFAIGYERNWPPSPSAPESTGSLGVIPYVTVRTSGPPLATEVQWHYVSVILHVIAFFLLLAFLYLPFRYLLACTAPVGRCDNCGYDLRGSRGDRCPECGERYTVPQQGDDHNRAPGTVMAIIVALGAVAAVAIVIWFAIETYRVL